MSSIKGAIQGFDTSTEQGMLQKEILETLSQSANQQAEIFMMEIMNSVNGNERDNKIPIAALVDQTKEIRAFTSDSMSDIKKTVGGSVDSFLNGGSDVVKGIGKILSGALTAFLGEGVASSDKTERYFVLTEGISIIRFDVKAWYHSVSSKSIRTKAEKIVCIIGTKSIVDFSKIDLSTFIYFYQKQLIQSGMDASELKKEIENVKKIYNEFHDQLQVVTT